MTIGIKRRDFIKLLSGTAATWPFAAHAQQSDRVRRVGVLIGIANDAESRARIAAFEQGLEKLGWQAGRNLQIEYRFAYGDLDRMRTLAKELVDLRPDVILAHSTPVTGALLRLTRTIPIVFVVVSDPVGSGFVTSVARPGGNITGFANLESSMISKFLEMLKDMMPQIARVALMFNPNSATGAGSYYLRPFMASAPSFAVEPITAQVHDPAEIEHTMTTLGREPGSGLIVMPDNFTTVNRELIVSLAARHRVPAIYPYRFFADAGGLTSYGVDLIDIFRRAPSYVDRILKGEKPADLPVQAPTKFELVINLKTAKALGLTVPRRLVLAADDVIE
jgi:putative tryptophan/tyrosine transport system substrate-binding protein